MLDSVGYLTSFGWKGKGNGLRPGSASRPLAVPQKRTLSGLGKDRDEAYPFWDHVFVTTAKSIQIRVSGDADEVDEGDSILPDRFPLHRTATGILSNRRPIAGTPATSGTATPSSDADPRYPTPRHSLMATVKRESARKGLYARFFKGETLGTEEGTKLAIDTATNTVQRGLECQNMDTEDWQHKTLEQQTKTKEKKKRKRDNPKVAAAMSSRKKKRHTEVDSMLRRGMNDPGGQRDTEGKRQRESEKGRPPEFSHTEWTEVTKEKQHRKVAKVERRKQQRRVTAEKGCGSKSSHTEP